MKRLKSNMGSERGPADFEVEFDRGGSVARRKTEIRPDGLYLFEDELEISGVLTTTVVACKAWLLELYDARAGQLAFRSGEDFIQPKTDRFGVLYSPFSLVEPRFNDFKGHLAGLASTNLLPVQFTSNPIVFDSLFAKPPSCLEEVLDLLKAADNIQSIELNPKPSLLSLKAKRMIDEKYLLNPSISQIAATCAVTPEHLSRQFKCDFTMSPRNYLRVLKLADAPRRLAAGEQIANVSHDVGYNDLSRFYKQFRKTTEMSPGACKTLLRGRSTNKTVARKV